MYLITHNTPASWDLTPQFGRNCCVDCSGDSNPYLMLTLKGQWLDPLCKSLAQALSLQLQAGLTNWGAPTASWRLKG